MTTHRLRSILLTGFEPFGGESVNPSYEATKQLAGYTLGLWRVSTMALPVCWNSVPDMLGKALTEVSPEVVLAVGQAGGRAQMAIERIAVNMAVGTDNVGLKRNGQRIIEDAPDGYFASIPLAQITDAIGKAGVPVYISESAGLYLCNFTLFWLEHLRRSRALPIRTGFIHIPYLPEQTFNKLATMPSMSLDTVVRGLRAAVDYLAHEGEGVSEAL